MDYVIQTPQQLSAHLRALRKARGSSQAALGESLGVGQTRVARIEGDPAAISVRQLVEVLAALGASLVLRDTQAGAGSRQAVTVRRTSKPSPGGGDW